MLPARLMFIFSRTFGMLPFTFDATSSKRPMVISRIGVCANFAAIIFLIDQMRRLCWILFFKTHKQTPTSNIGIIIRVTNAGCLLIICLRRHVYVRREQHIINGLLVEYRRQLGESEWRTMRQYRKACLIFLLQLCDILMEYVLFAYVQTRTNRDVYFYDLGLLLRLAYENSAVVCLLTLQLLYRSANRKLLGLNYLNERILQRTRAVYANLYFMKADIVNHCSLDMLMYFTSSQLRICLVTFDSTKQYTRQDGTLLRVMLECMRFVRLFVFMTYMIWRWCKLTDEVV